MKENKAAKVLGKALEDFSCQADTLSPVASGCMGKIQVYVNVSYADPKNILANLTTDDTGNILVTNVSSKSIALSSTLQINGKEVNGTLDDGLTAISTSLSDALENIATTSKALTSRVVTLEENQASLSAQLAQNNTSVATNASSISNLTRKVGDILSSLSASASPSAVSIPSFTPFVASSAAELGLNNFDTTNATISGVLNVLGRTTLNDLGFTGNFTSGLLAINGLGDDGAANINSIAGNLKLQNLGLGGLDILSGKVLVGLDGNVTIQQSLNASVINTQKLNIVTTDTTASSSGVLSASAGVGEVVKGSNRSEERRVGKECRSRWSPYH